MLDPAAQGAPEVHLWNLHLLAAAPREAELGRLLSPEERSRAERLHSERERRRFVVRRGRLRQILAQYLGGEPASIVLRAGSFGKPELAGAGAGPAIRFSASHAEDFGLVALARDHELGLDVVAHHPRNAGLERVAALLAPEEQSWLARMPSAAWVRGFFDLWACKEAFVKAIGLGLACPLDQFAVAFTPDHAPRLLYAPPSVAPRSWALQRLEVGPGFSAALAVEGNPPRLRQFA